MRILNLNIKNIGPFLEGNIDFITEKDNLETPPITIITGENGTGKTIILDAIRAMFLGDSQSIERNILRNKDFYCMLKFHHFSSRNMNARPLENINEFDVQSYINPFFILNQKPDSNWNWVIQYWTSKLSTDSFAIRNLVSPNPNNLYYNSLSGVQPNVEVVELICFFDYLRTSENEKERLIGEKLFEIIKKNN